jgi:dipeptidase E
MRLLLISSSNVHGHGFLDHAEPDIRAFLGGRRRVVFAPFAMKDRDAYTARVAERLGRMDIETTQLRHGAQDLDGADALFVGGGNTFRLLNALYERNLVREIQERVRSGKLLYIGSSAGTNIAAPTIKTTNDMPIIEPPSFDALGFVPFQINPHYLDPDPNSTHKGETREDRIREFLEENDTPVIGLREGSALLVDGNSVTLNGEKRARLFRRGAEPVEIEPGRVDVL